MLGRKLGVAIIATVLAAGSLTGLQDAFYAKAVSSPKAMYLWAEFKMLMGDKESASKLLQEATLKQNRVQKTADRPQAVQTEACSKTPADSTTMLF